MRSQKKSETESFIKNRKISIIGTLTNWLSRWQSGVMRLVERSLSGSNISDRLGGDLTQIQHLQDVNKQIEDIRVVSPPIFSKQIDIDGTPTYQASLQRKLGVLKDCAVNTKSGLIRLNSGFIIDSTLPHWQQLLYQGGMVSEYRSLRKPKNYLYGTYLVVPSARYFYHFIVEDLPNISWALEYKPECKILLSEKSPKWQTDVLKNLEIDFCLTEISAHVIERVVFVTAPRVLTSSDIKRIQGFRRNQPLNISDLNIYISRGNKDRGNEKLENELVDFLSSKGYIVIYPDEMSFAEQKMYFERATKVISFHGGALTNLVWCQPRTEVLEIFNHPFRTYDYKKLSSEAELTYFSMNLSNLDSESDVYVQLSKLIPESFLIDE